MLDVQVDLFSTCPFRRPCSAARQLAADLLVRQPRKRTQPVRAHFVPIAYLKGNRRSSPLLSRCHRSGQGLPDQSRQPVRLFRLLHGIPRRGCGPCSPRTSLSSRPSCRASLLAWPPRYIPSPSGFGASSSGTGLSSISATIDNSSWPQVPTLTSARIQPGSSSLHPQIN